MQSPITMSNELNSYKVVFQDGRIERVYGKWAAHAWANAQHIWPDRQICELVLVAPPSEIPDATHESNLEAVV